MLHAAARLGFEAFQRASAKPSAGSYGVVGVDREPAALPEEVVKNLLVEIVRLCASNCERPLSFASIALILVVLTCYLGKR
ncbi:hypothetical protein BZM26_36205 [Paraburkholderia strydomiana]|nr:hypothetical protein BZM26_36205 [Paraburkholderia strydomiana]